MFLIEKTFAILSLNKPLKFTVKDPSLCIVLPENLQTSEGLFGVCLKETPILGKSKGIAGGFPSKNHPRSPERKNVCSGIPGIIGPLKVPEYKL
jgi:hypothetical protein